MIEQVILPTTNENFCTHFIERRQFKTILVGRKMKEARIARMVGGSIMANASFIMIDQTAIKFQAQN